MDLTEKLIDGLYTEAMLLADEARGYFDDFGRESRNTMAPMQRVTFSCESLKVTTRLMHVVAWLLARRSVIAGREADIAPLSAAAPTDPDTIADLPENARTLIAASTDLYARVQRLEARISQGITSRENPALAMQRRLLGAF